jgi:hypothetical protein
MCGWPIIGKETDLDVEGRRSDLEVFASGIEAVFSKCSDADLFLGSPAYTLPFRLWSSTSLLRAFCRPSEDIGGAFVRNFGNFKTTRGGRQDTRFHIFIAGRTSEFIITFLLILVSNWWSLPQESLSFELGEKSSGYMSCKNNARILCLTIVLCAWCNPQYCNIAYAVIRCVDVSLSLTLWSRNSSK